MATEAQIITAFKKGVRNIVDSVRFNALRDAIASGNYDAAVRAVDIDDAAFDQLRALLLETYADGGVSEVTGMRFKPQVRWNGATHQAETYARLATEHMRDLTESMRKAVSWQIGDSVALGKSANKTALELVGRIGPSGYREGGIVGLNDQRAKWVADLRNALESGETPKRGLLTKSEEARIAKGNLSQQQIDAIVRSYTNRQLLSRGKAIARTERGLALNQGRYSAWVQAAEKLQVPYDAIRKKWKHNGNHIHERWSHVALGSDSAIPLSQSFIVGGYNAQYPHDPNLPAEEVVNCSCSVEYSINRNWRNG